MKMGLTNFNLVTTYQRDYSGVRTARPLTAAPASYRMASADKSAAERPVTRGGPEVNDWVVNARLYIQNNILPILKILPFNFFLHISNIVPRGNCGWPRSWRIERTRLFSIIRQ